MKMRRSYFLLPAIAGLSALNLLAAPVRDSSTDAANVAISRNVSSMNITDFNALPDGKTVNTTAIQSCIDACHAQGGGVVRIPAGVFLTGTLKLRDHITLYLEPGAVLKASSNLEDFPSLPSRHPSYLGEPVTDRMLILAEDVSNIAIEGRGVIDGGGDELAGAFGKGVPSFTLRPRILYFRNCERVSVRSVELRNGASWIQTYQDCRDVIIDGITVNSRENPDIEKERFADRGHRNTDGLDLVDCERVRISNCLIIAGDDGICLKSYDPDRACRDIVITNCIISTNASGIKIGTESVGAFEDIVVSNCTVYDTRCEGIAILTVDGARIERVTVSNIQLRNIKGGAIVVRLGARGRIFRKGIEARPGMLKDILIQGIQATRISADHACIIAGLPGLMIENVTLRDVRIELDGLPSGESKDPIPEAAAKYPGGTMFGILPSAGLFARHVKGLKLREVDFIKDDKDTRPLIVTEDVDALDVHPPISDSPK